MQVKRSQGKDVDDSRAAYLVTCAFQYHNSTTTTSSLWFDMPWC